MLHDFLTENREEIVARARARVKARKVPRATDVELQNGVPLFLTELVALLKRTMSGVEESTARANMDTHAGEHGQDLLAMGLTVAQVVHDYGDICQVVTELAVERNVEISATDFRAFNRCLDDAIAHAVTEFARVREQSIVAGGAERLGMLAHEMRNLVSTAMLSFDTIKRGVTGAGGSLGTLHSRALLGMRDLIDRSVTEVRLDADILRRERVVLAELIEEVEIAATMQAQSKRREFTVLPVDVAIVVQVDRHVLAGALANLLTNAFKFTRPKTNVSLTVHATPLRVCIDVEDRCGGLTDGKAEELFRPFERGNSSASGLGLGLTIARRAVDANGGELRVVNLAEVGCRFTIDLPRLVE